MIYEILLHATALGGNVNCIQLPGSQSNATLEITESAQEAWLTWVGDTNYNLDAGTPASNFSYRGPDPHDSLVSLLAKADVPFTSILREHVNDYKAGVIAPFSLDLGQKAHFDVPTDVLMSRYQVDASGNADGNVFIDWLTFNFGRYLLFSSARGLLPANLQGKWAKDLENPWWGSASSFFFTSFLTDLFAWAEQATVCRYLLPSSTTLLILTPIALDINIQMNYWMAEITNLDVTAPLFNFIEVRCQFRIAVD